MFIYTLIHQNKREKYVYIQTNADNKRNNRAISITITAHIVKKQVLLKKRDLSQLLQS